LLAVNVSVAPALTASPELPAVRPTVTLTLPDGADDSDTPNTSLVPCATEKDAGFTSSVPLELAGFSVTVTDAVVKPDAVALNVALPVLDESAAIVTVCAVAKLLGVNVSVPPELTDRPVLPEVRATVTVTLEVGAVDSETPKVPVEPCVTGSEVGLATTAGVVAGLTVTETAEEVAVVPVASKASAVSEYVPAGTLDHVNVYGLDVAVPSRVEPLKNSTLLIVPPDSDADAVMGIDAGAVNVAPLAGLVIDTVGVPPPPPLPLHWVPFRVNTVGAVLVPV